MHTQFGSHGIARAAADKGDASDDIFTFLIGHAIKTKLIARRSDGRCLRGTHVGMVAVGYATGARQIESILIDSLVEGPVEFKAILTATNHTSEVVGHILIGKDNTPETHLIHATGEVLVAEGHGKVTGKGFKPLVVALVLDGPHTGQFSIDIGLDGILLVGNGDMRVFVGWDAL